MELNRYRCVIGALLLVLLLADPVDLSSCGPFLAMAVFTRTTGPDDYDGFVQGQLGILQPTYYRAHLVRAYRILVGVPLDDQEQASRVGRQKLIVEDSHAPLTPLQTWSAARSHIPGFEKPLAVDPYRRITTPQWVEYLNCNDDAFSVATETLNSRVKQAGAASAEVRDWVAAQDLVFTNCSAGTAIPAEPPPSSSDRVRADRAYQIAAANFYAGTLVKAKALFQQIAADAQSPWHFTAAYVVARTDIRRGDFEQAQAELQGILADRKLAPVHSAAQSLLNYVNGRLDPVQRLLALDRKLMLPHSPSFDEDLDDYTFLYDRIEAKSARTAELAGKGELTDWIYAFQNSAKPDYNLARWREHKNLPWLIAALRSPPSDENDRQELLRAAAAVSASSPAFASVRAYQTQILLASNDNQNARSLLDETLSHDLPPSARNLFRAERMKIAGDFDELLRFAPREIAAQGSQYGSGFEWDREPDKIPLSAFDEDATSLFDDSLPLSYWLRAVRTERLAIALRTEIAQAGFVRAFLTNQASAADFGRELKALNPAYATDLGAILSQQGEAQRFAAAFWMLHHPELQPWIRPGFQRSAKNGKIDDFRDNWWCDPSGTTNNGVATFIPAAKAGSPKLSFLSSGDGKESEKEKEALSQAGSAPTYLSTAVVNWARSHPGDSRLAEALFLAVRTSRFGCTDGKSTTFVKQAFELLHLRFPNSEYAKRTPYWFP
jgi:hypothetical protein